MPNPTPQEIEAEIDQIYVTDLKDQPPHTPEQVYAVRQVIKLFTYCFKYNMYDEVRKLVHKDYKQHDLSVTTGVESIIQVAEKHRHSDGTSLMQLFYKRVLVDGEYIIVHMQGNIGPESFRVVDIFRYQNGWFTEHWDVVNPIPPREEWVNPNGPF